MSPGGHGAMPRLTADPINAMTKLVEAIQSIPAREISALESCVVNIGFINTPGSRWNVIPSEIAAEGTVLIYSEDTRQRIFALIEERTQKIAELYHCGSEFHRKKYAIATINDRTASQYADCVCRAVLGDGRVDYADVPDMGAEDFGFFLQKKPGAMIWLGAADQADPHPHALHSPYVKFDLSAFLYGVAIHVNLVSMLGETVLPQVKGSYSILK